MTDDTCSRRFYPQPANNHTPEGNMEPVNTTNTAASHASARVVNRLDAMKTAKLVNWLELHRGAIIAQKGNAKVVADQATAALEFTVTPNNVKATAKSMELELAAGGGGGGGSKASASKAIMAALADLTWKIDRISEALASIIVGASEVKVDNENSKPHKAGSKR